MHTSYIAKLSELRSFDLEKLRLNVDRLSNYGVANIVTPLNLRKNFVSDACICNHTLAVISEDS